MLKAKNIFQNTKLTVSEIKTYCKQTEIFQFFNIKLQQILSNKILIYHLKKGINICFKTVVLLFYC